MKPEELETPRVNYKHMKLNLFLSTKYWVWQSANWLKT